MGCYIMYYYYYTMVPPPLSDKCCSHAQQIIMTSASARSTTHHTPNKWHCLRLCPINSATFHAQWMVSLPPDWCHITHLHLSPIRFTFHARRMTSASARSMPPPSPGQCRLHYPSNAAIHARPSAHAGSRSQPCARYHHHSMRNRFYPINWEQEREKE